MHSIDDFKIDSEHVVEITIDNEDLYLSVDVNCKEVEAKFDQNGKLIIQLKEKYKCRGFEGTAEVEVKASTGIFRDEHEFAKIIKQNRYDIEQFTVTFRDYKDSEGDCNCKRDTQLEKSTHLSFERGRIYIREGDKTY